MGSSVGSPPSGMSLIAVVILSVIGIVVISAIVLAARRKAKHGGSAAVPVETPAAAATQHEAAPEAAGILLSVACPGCGAMSKVLRGQSVECEYCGARLRGA